MKSLMFVTVSPQGGGCLCVCVCVGGGGGGGEDSHENNRD